MDTRANTLFTIFIFIFSSAAVSCSLKYEGPVSVESKVPEFIFQDTAMSRYQSSKIKLHVTAERLEQYKTNSETYAKGVNFSTFDSDGNISTKGSCGYLSIDAEKKLYEMYDNIELENISEKTKFYANTLKWNERTEQLTGGRADIVKVEKEDAIIRGTGFSASGISKSFSFRGNVTGDIQTREVQNEK